VAWAASDVGGTFTDVVLAHRGRLWAAKVPTTPAALERGVAVGIARSLREAGLTHADLDGVVHGTTAATNAVLQRRGARVALLTNEGFEDAIEIGRQDRPQLYDLHAVRPAPLVTRALRFGVRGRLDKDGRELEPLDERAVLAAGEAMAERGVAAAAVCFLHSYANAAHEERAAALLSKAGVPRVCASSDVSPEFREAERLSTTVANAFLLPVMEGYLERLESGLRAAGHAGPLLVMESAGGAMSAREAARLPVRTVLSGPAGGAAACAHLARLTRRAALLGLDMGGTSTDICALGPGGAPVRHEGSMAGLPLRVPMLDIVTIGAGGGSIARVDAGGMLRVGPESAEARPGPACYALGGTEATVTDADVVLGRIAPEHFLGGAMLLEPALARSALARLGRALGCPAEEAAQAVAELAADGVARGVRLATTERGLDPRGFTLCPFGGAGPLHAAGIARRLGMRHMLVPFAPAVLSAWGMLVADVQHHAARTLLRTGRGIRPAEVVAALAGLERGVRARMAGEGFRGRAVRVARQLDLRYEGQSHELSRPLPHATEAAVRRALAGFHAAHRRTFGHAQPGMAVQLVAVRVAASASRGPAPLPRLRRGDSPRPRAAALGTRDVWFAGVGARRAVVTARGALRAGDRVRGPAVLEGGDHTCLLPPGARARADAWGNLEVAL
jgi:N-methylhydantoinase A